LFAELQKAWKLIDVLRVRQKGKQCSLVLCSAVYLQNNVGGQTLCTAKTQLWNNVQNAHGGWNFVCQRSKKNAVNPS
jgi:hypothetical protein